MATNDQEEQKLPDWWYQPQYQNHMDSLARQIQNRPAFQFKVDQEALYDYYRGEYDRQGREAKLDTQARGAGLTGGYDNSYARRAGEDAYEGYMDSLQEDVVPELRQMALDKYTQDGEALVDRYTSLQKQERQAYKTWQETYKEQIKAWEEEQAKPPEEVEEVPEEPEESEIPRWATVSGVSANLGGNGRYDPANSYANHQARYNAKYDVELPNVFETHSSTPHVLSDGTEKQDEEPTGTFDAILENAGYGVTNYPKAVSRLRNMGVSQEVMQGLLTEEEWGHLRDDALAASEADEGDISMAAVFDTYLEYLRFYVAAAELAKNGGNPDYTGHYTSSMGKADGMGVAAGVS